MKDPHWDEDVTPEEQDALIQAATEANAEARLAQRETAFEDFHRPDRRGMSKSDFFYDP